MQSVRPYGVDLRLMVSMKPFDRKKLVHRLDLSREVNVVRKVSWSSLRARLLERFDILVWLLLLLFAVGGVWVNQHLLVRDQ